MRGSARWTRLCGWLVLAPCLVAPAAGAAEAQPTRVDCGDGRMSVTARGVKLSLLLEEVARRCGAMLVMNGTLEREVSLGFRDLPLHAAFRRLLEGHDYVIEQAAPARDRPAMTVRVLGEGAKVVRQFPAAAPGASAPADESLRALQQALRSSDPDVREDAVHALGESRRPEAVAVLAPALLDASEDVRSAAFLAMVDLGGPGAVQALAGVLTDPRSSVRIAAVEALSSLEQPDLPMVLVPALQDADEAVREYAFSALAAMEERSVTEALGAIIGDSRTDVRLAAVEGLSALDGDRATALLRTAASDADASVRAAAAEALQARSAAPTN